MGQHWRTNRAIVGGDQSPGSPDGSKYALPQHSLASHSTFEGGQFGEPRFDEREFGAHCLFLFLMLSPFVIVGGIVVAYLTFVPQAIQY